MRRNSYSTRKMTAAKWAIFVCLAAATFAQTAFGKAVGTVKSINGNSIVLTTDAGAEVTVSLTDSTRILRAAPGQTDLKSATPIQVSDIKVGDRILALGPAGEGNSTLASIVVVMKQNDIAEKQQQEREQWRKGVGGIVKEVDASAGTITVSNTLVAAGKPVVIHVSPGTTIRRYSPDSVKFDDAQPGKLDEIKSGDQLRARGEKSVDGTEFTAQAIVTGTFRQIAGTVISTDAANSSVTVMDLSTKKPVTLKLTSDSQLHKLPPMMAQRLAMRLKGGSGLASEGADSRTGERSQGASAGSPSDTNGRGREGTPDFQQMLSRMSAVSISDLQKGDALMLVATQGSENSSPTAITLLTGVEPILSAAPNGAAAATILSPWNLGASPGGGDAAAE